MDDLLALEATATGTGPAPFRPATPLKVAAWSKYLEGHPDQGFASYIVRGITQGFHIGASRAAIQFKSADRNLQSVQANPTLVEQHIQEEVRAFRLRGPLPPVLASTCHTSPIGLIPKPNQPGEWRLIVDLSSPMWGSTNDAIGSDICSLRYASLDDAAAMVRRLGTGTLLAKLDLKKAYRMIPVHPDDHALLGIKWGPNVYIDTALPFGLRSAPKIFSAVADALAWAMHCNGIQWHLHYLDDFLFVGPPKEPVCAQALRTALDTCEELGMPVAFNKVDGPSTRLTFLGIQVDSGTGELSLPPPKLQRIKSTIQAWLSANRKATTKRELQSPIGLLSHAATVVPPGRTFLRQLIDAAKIGSRPSHFIRLNAEVRSDLQWWSCFLESWNGRSLLPPALPSVTVTADASGSWGCGAFSSDHQWFQVQWPESWASVHIAAKEMVPVVLAVAVWGKRWVGQAVRVNSDNMAVVATLKSGACQDQALMHLMRCLHFFAAYYQLKIMAAHVPGKDNAVADALSRNDYARFSSVVPQCQPVHRQSHRLFRTCCCSVGQTGPRPVGGGCSNVL